MTGLEYGVASIARGNEILRTVVGSGVHGLAIAGTDDHDEMGVYIEPPEHVLGVENHRDSYVWRTKGEGERSGPGDTDLVIYALQKYLRLAVVGNPTALLPLFAPESDVLVSTTLGQELRDMRSLFLSNQAVERFLGYMHQQHERMLGRGRQGRVPNRPELIEKYGWDVKYGSHALRLAYEGYEIASQGTLTLPMPHEHRERVLAVKRGEVSREEVSAHIAHIERLIKGLLRNRRTPLRNRADISTINAWSVSAMRRWWGWV